MLGTSSTSVAVAANDDCMEGTEMKEIVDLVLIKAEVYVVADRAATRRKGNLRTMRSLTMVGLTFLRFAQHSAAPILHYRLVGVGRPSIVVASVR